MREKTVWEIVKTNYKVFVNHVVNASNHPSCLSMTFLNLWAYSPFWKKCTKYESDWILARKTYCLSSWSVSSIHIYWCIVGEGLESDHLGLGLSTRRVCYHWATSLWQLIGCYDHMVIVQHCNDIHKCDVIMECHANQDGGYYAILWPVLNRISIIRSPVEIPFRALLFGGIK